LLCHATGLPFVFELRAIHKLGLTLCAQFRCFVITASNSLIRSGLFRIPFFCRIALSAPFFVTSVQLLTEQPGPCAYVIWTIHNMASFTVLPLVSYLSYKYYFSTASSSSSSWSLPSILLASFVAGYIPAIAINIHLSRSDGWLIKSVQRWQIWRRIVNFSFHPDSSITLETPLDDDQLYIYCCFPHGTASCNHLMTVTDACGMLSQHHRGDRRDLAALVLFTVPFLSDLLLWLGGVDASSATAHHNLRKRRSLLIFVGGEREQLMTKENQHKIYLAKRKGFVKLALQYGAHLVPMYCFGENECYTVSSFLLPFRQRLQSKFQLGVPLCWGRWYMPLLPHPTPLNLELGAPITVAKKAKEDITNDDIDALHAAFMKEELRLFDRTKMKYKGQEDAVLEIQ
jgi:1-acyl-sn-glycerol-3-phosphate acyltransferase